MRRRLFNILAALSFLLCLATAGLWVRSYWRLDHLWNVSVADAKGIKTEDSIASLRGLLSYRRDRAPDFMSGRWLESRPASRYKVGLLFDMRHSGHTAFGFGFGRAFDMRAGFKIVIPLWFLTLLFAVLPLRWLQLFRRCRFTHSRARRGLCITCGYDLRATPDPQGPLLPRCPECGTEAAPTTSTPSRQARHLFI